MGAKKRWLVTGEVTISVHTIVEAETEVEAKLLADNRMMPSLCHHCGNDDGNTEEWRTSGELDGAPNGLSAEELKS